MSRLEVPLKHRLLYATGDLLLRAELILLVKDGLGGWHKEAFRHDSGSEISTMPAYRAKKLRLPVPLQAAPGAVHGPTGLEIRSGYLRVIIPGLDAKECAFPCFFLGDPDVFPSPRHPSSVPRNLLGLSGVIDQLRVYCDGTPTPGSLHGNLVVERK
jgi:hypothetical protein